VETSIADKKWKSSAAELTSAIARLEEAAVAFGGARDRALTAQPSRAALREVNAKLMRVERELTRPEGLVTRPWFRNLIYASDENNGYATMVLPSVNEAIRAGEEKSVSKELTDLAHRFDAAAQLLRDAAALIK